MRTYLVTTALTVFSFFTTSISIAAPLARQPDLTKGAPKPSPRPKNSVQEMDNAFIEPSTEDLLSNQPMLKADAENFPEKLPESLPEDPDFSVPKKKAASNLSEIPTAPQATSSEIQTTPPQDSAAGMQPEVDTSVPGLDVPASSDVAEFPTSTDPHEEALDEPLDEERLVSEPESLEAAPPVVEASSSYDDSDSVSEKQWVRGIPRYDQERPTIGFQISYSPNAINDDLTATNEVNVPETYTMSHLGLALDWQPKFIQSIGVVALGVSGNIYPVAPLDGITDGGLDIWSVGVSAKYQAKWFRGQWVVPYAGYETQYLNYKTNTIEIGSGNTMLSGPVFGALLLLNWMEPRAAFELYDNTGIKRSYLFAEWKSLSADTEAQFSTNQASLHFGLRLEL